MAKVCATAGTVHAVRMSQDGKTADLTIHHGDAPASTKANPFPERPQTTHTIQAKHAGHFPVGTPVKMTLSTANTAAPQADGDADDEETENVPSSAIGKAYAMGSKKGS